MLVEVIGEVDADSRRLLDARVSESAVGSHDGGDCLLLWQTDVPVAVAAIARMERLQWVHMRNAGVPGALLEACEAGGAILTNGSGAHADAIGEYVVCALLALTKRLPDMLANQRNHAWRPDVGVRELAGATVGIIGLGSLGRACARLLRPFGVRLVGVSRSGTAVAEVDEVYVTDALPALLPRLDALVIAAPLTAATVGLVGRRELDLLPSGAVVVNVGRGEILDEDALLERLLSGRLAGAALDVFTQEPLPEGSPLWSAPNLIISPHCIDETPQTAQRGLALFFENLERWLGGQPLINVVRAEFGY